MGEWGINLPGFWLFATNLFWSCQIADAFFLCLDYNGFPLGSVFSEYLPSDQVVCEEIASCSDLVHQWPVVPHLLPAPDSLPWLCWRNVWRGVTLPQGRRMAALSLFWEGMDWQGGDRWGFSSFKVLCNCQRRRTWRNAFRSRIDLRKCAAVPFTRVRKGSQVRSQAIWK